MKITIFSEIYVFRIFQLWVLDNFKEWKYQQWPTSSGRVGQHFQFYVKAILIEISYFDTIPGFDEYWRFFLTISENLDCNDLIDEFEKKRKEKHKKEADKRKSAPSGGSESKKKKVR